MIGLAVSHAGPSMLSNAGTTLVKQRRRATRFFRCHIMAHGGGVKLTGQMALEAGPASTASGLPENSDFHPLLRVRQDAENRNYLSANIDSLDEHRLEPASLPRAC